MGFILNGKNIEEGRVVFIYEDAAYSGVRKIADKVRKDISHVFGKEPSAVTVAGTEQLKGKYAFPVIFGTIGMSPLMDGLISRGLIDVNGIRDKREVYSFNVISEPFEGADTALVICGSDKRGTIYGLFRISELLNVSPLTDWCDIMPDKRTETVFIEADDLISKEPSVRYRGFFINDEWPAFGNWTNKNFGGFNAQMYEHVFELLLRLKGNYLWPAMWTSIFADDGPGLKNAELADELGVVMGLSHHEPCLRHGEEYKYLRGPGSIYGDAWNFLTNEEGITRFWEDGLKRNGKFENVITVGMRGEYDSTIMGKDATLKDNIDLLRAVLKTQNRLIKENVNADIDKVPRMLALYKEVEPFFYGDEETEGLMDSPELEGVTLMLCDDNFGNLRTLPTEHMREHRGGYGMYYHFDYHGWPVSYEWVNSSYLPKVWEQMTNAYEFGIRDLWIVNVGDIFTNEYPLSYFMSLAYDYDKWGIGNINSADEFNREFVDAQFGNGMEEEDKAVIVQLLKGYTRIAHLRRPEAMNDKVYHAVNFGELEDMTLRITQLCEAADMVSSRCDEKNAFTFFQLVGYPLVADLNLYKLWLAATENHYLASIKAGYAVKLADEVRTLLRLDKALTDRLHEIQNGKWYGMGMSEHIGFTQWNEEECQYPVLYEFERGNKPRFIVTIPGTDQHTEGGVWTGKKLILPDFLDPSCDSARIMLYAAGKVDAGYEVICDVPWLTFGEIKGKCRKDFYEMIYVKLDRSLSGDATETTIRIHGESGDTDIVVPVNCKDYSDLPDNTYVWLGREDACVPGYKPYDHIAMEAAHFCSSNETAEGYFIELPEYGRTLSAMKAIPVTKSFKPGTDAPSLDYRLYVEKEDEYEVRLYMQPSNPAGMDNKITYGISSAAGDMAGNSSWDEEIEIVNVIPEGYKVGDEQWYWARGVLDNIRVSTSRVILNKGLNTLRIFAASPCFVPERIVICEADAVLPQSYLGPKETYRVKKNDTSAD